MSSDEKTEANLSKVCIQTLDNSTPVTATQYRWPTDEELAAAFSSRTLAQERLAEMVCEAEAAFAAGAEYVSLTMGDREVGRIYPDGRHWSPPITASAATCLC